jgi:hypothetical protein
MLKRRLDLGCRRRGLPHHLTHRRPQIWIHDVERLHGLLQTDGMPPFAGPPHAAEHIIGAECRPALKTVLTHVRCSSLWTDLACVRLPKLVVVRDRPVSIDRTIWEGTGSADARDGKTGFRACCGSCTTDRLPPRGRRCGPGTSMSNVPRATTKRLPFLLAGRAIQ